MEKKEFSQIRHFLGKTQGELARLLCVSTKAIQSFEQGWRSVPSYVERQLLLYISLKTAQNKRLRPCWEIKNCSQEWRENCIVWEYKARYFCWFINGTYCQGKPQNNWNTKIQLCRSCKIYRSIIPET